MVMIQQINAARRACAPIVAVTTPDPASTIRTIQLVYGDKPLAQWDVVNGVRSINSLATAAVNKMHTVEGVLMPASVVSSNPVSALSLSAQLPEDSILFFHNAHFYVEQTASDSHKPVVQAVWNCRDTWRGARKTLILLAPSINLPAEIRNDVAIIDEPLPTDKDMAAIVARGLSRAMARKQTRAQSAKLVDAVAGLAAFNAEQVIAMSVSPKTRRPNMNEVWSHKIKLIEQARGLKVYRHGAKLSQIGGMENMKTIMIKIAKGSRAPRLIVFMDEIEKTMQAAGTDTSGTTTDQLKVLLTKMQDNGWTGFMIYGFAGTGKSQLAKAFGNECGCPTVEADLGSMKNMWVGSSEANMRGFIKTIEAMGGREVFFIATCNSVVNLPPEFKRRFRKGVWFCDLPTFQERKQIWDIYLRKLGIALDVAKPNDDGWTGAEIELCCENSHEFGISLEEASRFMTITSQAMGDQVEKMRMAAHGKFINASHPGIYHYIKPEPEVEVKKTTWQKLKGE